MSTADASVLKTEDASFLISSAMNSLESVRVNQDKLLKAFYEGQSSQFELVRESYMMQPGFSSLDKVFPLVLGDKGNTLASVSTIHNNRIAAYGYDILSGFDPANTIHPLSVRPTQTQHKPVFKRVLAWLVTGNPSTDWSAQVASNLPVAWASLPTSSAVFYTNSKGVKVYKPYAMAGLTALGIPYMDLNCDPLSDPIKDCAAKAKLVIVGAIDGRVGVDLNTQLQRLQEIVKSNIPILYLNAHPDGGAPNDYARAAFKEDHLRHKAMGFSFGDIPDKRNYYVQDFVSGSVSFAERRKQYDYLGNLITRLSSSTFSAYDWSGCFDTNRKWEPTHDANGIEQPTSGLRRPMYLRSSEFPLKNDPITVVSPYGGLLLLVFKDAKDAKVSLQIKGAAKHPFYDTTQGAPDAKTFLDDIKKNPIGWLEIKTPGMEIHSITVRALEFLEPPPFETYAQRVKYPNDAKPYYHRDTGIDMTKYLAEAKRYVMESSYQLAGLRVRGLELKPSVHTICQSLQWDCTHPITHSPPIVQHFQTDMRANCGSMCSGQPIDSGSGFGPRGWGESHEMGHNLQWFKVYDGVSTEVSNNIFPLHNKWQLFRDLGREQIGYWNELGETQTLFDLIKSVYKNTSLNTVEAKRASMKTNLWGNPVSTYLNRSRLYFYLQWPLIYHEVLKEKNPGVSEADLWEQAWDIYTLMYLNIRQVAATSDTDWPLVKDKLGFGSYNQKPWIKNEGVLVNGQMTYPMHDYLLVMLSKLTGKDQRPIFDLWGIDTYAAGRNQVALMNLPAQPVKFYAVVCSDDFRTRRVIDLTDANPTLPLEWGTEPFKDQIANAQACQKATTAYEPAK